MLKIVAISDTHENWGKLVIPECDILISAGDYSFRGSPNVVKDFHAWLNIQPAKHVISVQGNHESWVEKNFLEAKQIALEACSRVNFIDEGLVVINGVNFWGSAVTPFFCNWAWNRHSHEIQEHWDKIPANTNVLITHGPPYNVLDLCPDGRRVGCPKLMTKIREVKPKVHIFGHIHWSYGQKEFNGTQYYNAAICNESYNPFNPPTVIEYDETTTTN